MLHSASQFGGASLNQRQALPRFLIISPPKTGSTWLAANLAAHPALSLPPTKETRFFSSTWKWRDLDWYLSRFPIGSAETMRGESSPTYAILPVQTIRLLHSLVPDLKLIFLMRDPVARAWSHAKHTWRYKVRDFAGCTVPLQEVPDAAWHAAFRHDWTMASGDYLGQLRRWLSVFPREQLFVSFYERIAANPRKLLVDVFRFLGIPRVDACRLRAEERVNAGVDGEFRSTQAECLRRIHQPFARDLMVELRRVFDLTVPSAWEATLEPAMPAGDEGGVMERIREHEFDDDFLARTVAGEEDVVEPWPLHDDVFGYRLFLYRRTLFALGDDVLPESLPMLDEEGLASLRCQGRCFQAPTLAETRDAIAEFRAR
jgi:hypothetical protein